MKASGLRGRGRRRVPDRREVVVRAAGHRQADVRRGELRRVRARHLQQPRARRARAPPVPRGDGDRGVRGPEPHRVRVLPRRVPVARAGPRAARSADAYADGVFGASVLGTGYALDVVLHRGAGAYICGEETALLSSLEGYRGQPRLRPPFPAVEGLYASPTVINNVETLANVPTIMTNGAEWFAAIGPEKSPGTKLFSVSGKVERPGQLRGADGHAAPHAARGARGRRARRQAAEGVDAGRLLDADAHRRAPRRRAGLRVGRRGGLAARAPARSS